MNIGYYYNKIYFDHILILDEKDRSHLDRMKRENEVLTQVVYKEENKQECFCFGNTMTSFSLTTTYPGIFTGAGMPHESTVKGELKLGFYFDYTTGMPVIPGSSVKGLLRSAFPQWENHKKSPQEIKWAKTAYIYTALQRKENETFASFQKRWNNLQQAWENLDKASKDLEKQRISRIEKEIFDGIIHKDNLPVYNRDIFLDAHIIRGTIRNPRPGAILGIDSITPHIQDGVPYEKSLLKNPTPLPFLKILPDVQFAFSFILKDHRGTEADLPDAGQKELLFKTILQDIGIGAKTNIGYGQFDTNE